ncbi:MAG TPA: hypothetical protein PLU87_17145 [Sedimentisphaerales bacterium]|nr:hypothetical protein [Sedimentisphaerales bacterium]HRS12703.1 hypothetical protein [Sedimentisphaerales bacterium]HRV49315.1 hypothetical protein [Sedimentisphaerales bacterium]
MNLICRTFSLVTAVILAVISLSSAQVASSRVEQTPTGSVHSSAGVATDRLQSVLQLPNLASTSRSASVFIVPAQPMTTEELTSITEDVNVMRRIFENKLRQANLLPPAGPLSVFLGGGPRYFGGAEGDAGRTMYLQGYGVLFVMDVDYPLAPGPQLEPNQPPQQPQAETDPVWARTRDEIYRPASFDPWRDTDVARPRYSAEKVENLKTTVIQTLVHAANIRCLAPEESVIVRVTGSPESDVLAGKTIAIPGTGHIVVKSSNNDLRIMERSLTEAAQTVLTIRAKAADIKARAEGKLSDEQFRQRVQVLSQPVVGAAAMNPAAPSAGTAIATGERITR